MHLRDYDPIDQLIRRGEVHEAVKATVTAIVNAAQENLPLYSEILRKSVDMRRVLYCAALKTAAQVLEQYAEDSLKACNAMRR